VRTFTTYEFRGSLEEVGVRRGDIVMVHASLFPLGMYESAPGHEGVSRVISDLRNLLGPSGTLVVPTFTYAFCRGLGFDRQKSAGEKMGVFSECVRQMPHAIRSFHPIQSVAAVGARGREICSPDCTDAFAEQGPFGIMLRANAKLLLLGVSTRSASLFHYSEERITVPYRFWKNFTGPYTDHGISSERTYRMYARDLERNPVLKLHEIPQLLGVLLATARLGGGWVSCCSFQDYLAVTCDALRRDPWFFIESSAGMPSTASTR
jgi:aminoglycoside 3-N-acetyltransferase